MPEQPAAGTPGGDRIVQGGLRRFRRLFNVIVGVFGVLFALQTGDAFVADLPTMADPLGRLIVVLVIIGVLAGLVPVLARRRARAAFLAGSGLYVIALLLWPLSIHAPIPTDPMPWLVAVWPVPVAYAAQAGVPRVLALVGAAALSGYTGFALRFAGSLDTADAVVNSLFMTGIAVVLVLLLGVVRRGIVTAAGAQQAALVGFAASRIDEATETERKRTDALLHDAVLTTFLSAAAARTEESHRLARRMSANSLRVLMHVNGVERDETVLPFGRALEEERQRLQPLLLHVDADLSAIESIMLPAEAARAVVAVLAHALAECVEVGRRPARPTLRADPLGPDGIRLRLEGCRFDPSTGPSAGLGSDDPVVRDLRAFEGRVDVDELAGDLVAVTVSWGSVVIVGTTPLLEEHGARLLDDRLALP